MIRRPPRSTPFPTRRSSDLDLGAEKAVALRLERAVVDRLRLGHFTMRPRADLRSEEHTSELQSQSNLVCRLLLEKKKKTPQCYYAHENEHVMHRSQLDLRGH